MNTRKPTRVPKYCHHKASGQAVVRIEGRDIYLGPHESPASRDEYDRLVGEWLVSGRRLPSSQRSSTDAVVTVNEVLVAYLRWAQDYYRIIQTLAAY